MPESHSQTSSETEIAEFPNKIIGFDVVGTFPHGLIRQALQLRLKM